MTTCMASCIKFMRACRMISRRSSNESRRSNDYSRFCIQVMSTQLPSPAELYSLALQVCLSECIIPFVHPTLKDIPHWSIFTTTNDDANRSVRTGRMSEEVDNNNISISTSVSFFMPLNSQLLTCCAARQ